VIVGAIVLIVVLGGGAAAWAAASSGNSGYRLATVTRADIGQSMTIVGTVEPVNDASASFQVAGQVATVTATVGQQVTAGQSMGTLDTTSLSESVSSAQSTLNSDEAKLTQDESSQSSSTSSTPSASSTPTTTTTTSPSKGGSSTGTQSTITQDQNTLTQDEAKTGTDQQKVAADLAHAQQACGTGTTTTTTSSTTTTTTTNPANCEAALAQVSKDQQQVSADQAAVATDEAALSQALSQASSSTSGSPTSTSGSPTQTSRALSSTPSISTGNSGSGTGTGTGTGGSSGGTGGGTGSSASADTPQQIAADQAAIDTAQAELTVAEQSLAEANLTSPINGTIVSVGINVGDTVSANSSTDVIVIIGTQSFEVAGTLSSSQVPSVKVGDSAGVQVDGIDGTMDGTVSQVGPVQSGTSGYTYPVVVALPPSATGLFTGSTANVVITTGAVANVVAVPTSAMQSLGSRSYVEMLSNGTLTRKVIKVGMVGDTYTQVLSGLTPGQSVVLADYAEPVPSSNTSTLGGFGGGGFGGGGFGGGGGGAFRIQRTTAGGGGGSVFGGG
jgi:HlyD family secretion protein